jgi:hypothetical protein
LRRYNLGAALQSSEGERRALRAKYIALGQRLEGLLTEDAAARDAAAAGAYTRPLLSSTSALSAG